MLKCGNGRQSSSWTSHWACFMGCCANIQIGHTTVTSQVSGFSACQGTRETVRLLSLWTAKTLWFLWDKKAMAQALSVIIIDFIVLETEDRLDITWEIFLFCVECEVTDLLPDVVIVWNRYDKHAFYCVMWDVAHVITNSLPVNSYVIFQPTALWCVLHNGQTCVSVGCV